MEQIKFKSYEQYFAIQKATVRRKGIGPFFTDFEIYKIFEWMIRSAGLIDLDSWQPNGICHGARNGLEADEFKKYFTESEVFGTDLFPYQGRSASYRGVSDVVEKDFSEEVDEWIGAFDFVYSNSFDHARYPEKTLGLWLNQLKPVIGDTPWESTVFIQWSKSGNEVRGGDCFGATLEEIIDLTNEVGVLRDLIYCNAPSQRRNILRRRALEVVVLAIGKRGGLGTGV